MNPGAHLPQLPPSRPAGERSRWRPGARPTWCPGPRASRAMLKEADPCIQGDGAHVDTAS